MSVSILLSDGSLGVVQLTPTDYMPGEGALPIQLIYLQQFAPGVTASFQAAAFSAYQLLSQKGFWHRRSGYAFVCEIKDEKNEGLASRMKGASGGLALFLALTTHILKSSSDGMNIAATGEIANIADGMIGPVEALGEKLCGGIQKLPPGSRVYFPKENKLEKNLLEAIKADTDSRGIDLVQVGTLEEAARGFFPTRVRRKLVFKVIWFCLALFSVYLAYAFVSCPLALHFLEKGSYGAAETHLAIATRLFPWETSLRETSEALEVPFQVRVRMRYLLHTGLEEQTTLSRARPELTLSASDSYAFHIRASVPVYLYALRIASDSKLHLLFPSPNFCSSDNPLGGNNPCFLPDRGRWFRPSGYEGLTETYFVFSRWRCKDLEEALLVKRSNRQLHVLKSDLELMILQRDREGCGALVERGAFWHR